MTETDSGKPKILIVDDMSENLISLRNILHEDYEVVTTTKGEAALQLAAESPQPELILLDIKMPLMDGYDVIRELKDNPVTAEIPVIFVSALTDEANEAHGLDLGAVDYITKPVNPSITRLRVHHQIALRKAQSDLLKSQQESMQNGRLASLGYLAAGIAHEINTPAQYISNNLSFLAKSTDTIRLILDASQKLAESAPNTEAAQRLKEICSPEEIEFILEEFPVAIKQSQKGIEHITSIVSSMKEFARPRGTEKQFGDIHKQLDSVIAITQGAANNVATVIKHYSPDLPVLLCNTNELRQVFLNLILNSIQAIESSKKREGDLGQITITTELRDEFVSISFADTGDGIPADIQDHIFDPFFTTKEVGQGSGQGLNICYNIIVNKHGGKIEVSNIPKSGAVFTILLPING
ncbi:MAG: response regulator [Candidatus Thiodiazotropha sp.]